MDGNTTWKNRRGTSRLLLSIYLVNLKTWNEQGWHLTWRIYNRTTTKSYDSTAQTFVIGPIQHTLLFKHIGSNHTYSLLPHYLISGLSLNSGVAATTFVSPSPPSSGFPLLVLPVPAVYAMPPKTRYT